MSKSTVTRRDFLGRSILGLVVVSGAGAALSSLAACGGGEDEGPNCTNPPGLTDAERTQRSALHYVDRSADPNKQCQRCNFFEAAGGAACGRCTLNLGGVSPLGSCDSFAARA